ncbi:aminoacyl-histidine dipeptidase [Azonexus hydrophilus]|uniref:aminoacyl-histidine dipeptidase n=1 Tax=Azonexus hydrophilus TaxID=418702 RepID=UPI000402BE91|nr:aminoacyl-histidine dipeptidase [Azonexus hydrophilus]
MTADLIAGLDPAAVWRHFALLCATPRASKQEAALRDKLLAWARARSLTARVDGAGNLILKKPATPGCENAPTVVLQAHLDMVCQKNADSDHDFSRDAIQPVLRDGWLIAEKTTLGADNGIGVALILAALEDQTLRHGPLEALLTIDEEAGMGGARGLAPGLLDASLMLNLDTEAWGEFYLGCAGGLDVDVRRDGESEPLPAGWTVRRIALNGLRGGHSGVDIHEERGNAIKLLVGVLHDLAGVMPYRLVSLHGGSARNALPREAFAVLALPEADGLEAWLAQQQAALRELLRGVDDGIALSAQAATADAVMAGAEQFTWLASLHAAPHGVKRFSRQVAGVVETSNNLGIVELTPDAGYANFMVRSLVDRAADALADEIVSLFALSGTAAEKSGQYPGWQPNPDSALLQTCQAVFKRDFGGDSTVQVIHAGLECGLIGAQYPGLDIVSFGPTIHGAHAPGERVEVATVERCWRLLRAILGEISGG